MMCSAARCGDRAVAVVDQGDGVERLACDVHSDAVALFVPVARVRRLSTRNGPSTPSDQTNTFPDRSHR